jgi:hypothetical protein
MFLAVLAPVLAAWAAPARAQDLAAIEPRALAALGAGYGARVDGALMTLTCPDCDGTPLVEIRVGRQEDGTEQRLRSGYTSITSLDQQCRARNPTCRVERADLGPAVGWVSAYQAGPLSGSTLVLLRQGALVLVRSVAGTPEVARGNVEKLRAQVLPALVGN